MICEVCSNSENNKVFHIKEMMYGIRDEFTYLECSECGCLQIAAIPRNMERYYPSNYHSFQEKLSNNFIKRYLRIRRNKYALFKKGLIGKVIYKKYPNQVFDMISKIEINHNSRVLDVGCGAGILLYFLKEICFENLVGVDPFIDKETINGDMKLLKKTIHELPDDQKFNLIIFNHSFEHIPDQLETLAKVSEILSEDGICFIRIPIKTEYIWSHYGVNWVQIDAPRHFFLHTLKSFEILVKKSGLVIKDMIFDSTDFQFWGSEQHSGGIPLMAKNSYGVNPKRSIFTSKQIKEFKSMSKELNTNKQGDQAGFFLRGVKK